MNGKFPSFLSASIELERFCIGEYGNGSSKYTYLEIIMH
jgi:hypothetical protein